ncbi:MAG: cadmium-translocating P-type ATPase [Bacteriovorax sp.]|nr:cadmium-translocating P-type ATPase [Bacteriovorax sp.]
MNKIFKIEGMTCASCSQIIEENVSKLPGIESIQVNFATEKADVHFKKERNGDNDIIAFKDLLEQLGYRALSEFEEESRSSQSYLNKTFFSSLFALMIGVFLMAISMGPLSHLIDHQSSQQVQLFFATLVLAILGRPYLKSVGTFLKTAHSNMNTLIGLGVLASYFYSLYKMFTSTHGHVYFETIPFIIGFTHFGHYLDDLAKTKARSSLSSLYKMQIKFAAKIENGEEVSTAVLELKKGDIIRLKPGDKIPLDGEVVQGSTHVDESMITGESIPLSKTSGHQVFAGSLNLEGSVLVKINQELHQTYIAQIVQFVEKAQLKKAPIQKYADKIVGFFVPIIIGIALLTFIAWWILSRDNKSYEAFTHMIAVLLIACPCALGLAVPMAVMLGVSEASKSGVLISGGDVIQEASSIETLVFDKTGTLTEGRPFVSDVIIKIDHAEFWKIVGSVVQYSNHPLSKAMTQYIESKATHFFDPDKFINLPGLGMDCVVDKKRVFIGKKELLESHQILVEDQDSVGSLVYVGIEQQFAGVFIINDQVKKSAKETLEKLRNRGFEIWMLTGDNELVAKKIAEELGIKKIKADVLPTEKAQFILELKKSGKKVAMIGDGLNDAPALTSANLAIAMSGGSDVAVEAADVSVLEGKIENLIPLFDISRKTMRVIKQNLFLSSFYNLLCIPLAAGAFTPWMNLTLTPMWASLAMGLSSLSVVLSSLRLKRSV